MMTRIPEVQVSCVVWWVKSASQCTRGDTRDGLDPDLVVLECQPCVCNGRSCPSREGASTGYPAQRGRRMDGPISQLTSAVVKVIGELLYKLLGVLRRRHANHTLNRAHPRT